MTAAFQPRTTGPAHLSGSRFASCRRAPQSRNTRPAKRVAGRKTAPRIFFRATPKPRQETAPQVTGTHLESRSYRYVFAPGCVVAPNSAATSTGGGPASILQTSTINGPAAVLAGTAGVGTADGTLILGGSSILEAGLLTTVAASTPFLLISGDTLPLSRATGAQRISSPVTVYRVWGGASGPLGPSWTPIDPRVDAANFRDLAGLPNVNTGQYLAIGILKDYKGAVALPAAPMPRGTGGTTGGWPEIIVPSPGSQIQIINHKINLPPPINTVGPTG